MKTPPNTTTRHLNDRTLETPSQGRIVYTNTPLKGTETYRITSNGTLLDTLCENGYQNTTPRLSPGAPQSIVPHDE